MVSYPHRDSREHVRRQAFQLPSTAQFLFPSPRMYIRHQCPSSVHPTMTTDYFDQGNALISMLPDDILVDIFNFYVNSTQRMGAWHTLIHVCHRWREVVFASPRRLNLRLLYTGRSPVRETLYVWPDLPISIRGSYDLTSKSMNNTISALKHNDRICEIVLEDIPSPLLERFAMATMTQNRFPALTRLKLWSFDANAPTLPDTFLSGYVPRLQTLHLQGIPFPVLSQLLFHSDELFVLRVMDIPSRGYVAPEAMIMGLSSLTKLRTLTLNFRSPPPHPFVETQLTPLTNRIVLPSLTHLWFKGTSEYLEKFIAQISTPVLRFVKITFFNQVLFSTPQVLKYIGRAELLRSPRRAEMSFYRHSARIKLPPQTKTFYYEGLDLGISCTAPDWQLSSLAQVCSSSLPPLSTVERLDICEDQFWRLQCHEDMENAQWRELLHPFSAIKSLYLSERIALRVLRALKELDEEGTIQVLPMLQAIFLEGLQSRGPVQEAIGQFVAVRQLSGHTVTGRRWERVQEV